MRSRVLVRGSSACFAVLLLAGGGPAQAFNPQPDPPGLWAIEGFIDLSVNEYVEAFPGSRPFGLPPGVTRPDGQPAFTIALRGTFAAAGQGQPVPGRHDGAFDVFDLEIGNARWTSANVGGLAFEIMSNNPHVYVTGATTDTSHQVLELFLPSSPGVWRATDVVNSDNRGHISGTYILRDGSIPEPTSLALTALGLAALTIRPRRSSENAVRTIFVVGR